ncbi:MAG TPA: sugar transferase [Vicinamibacteria bacterium]|nr:sugar transferase [Vicinamibacteria bacterium]
MSHERSLERWVLIQDVGVVLLSLWLAHVLRRAMEPAVSVFKPTVPLLSYGPLLLAFLPTWVWCAERVGLTSVRTLTGRPLDVGRALVWTQGWGALAVALLLTVTQTPLNRSLIALFFVISTVLLAVTQRAQRAWAIRERGEALALLVGGADDAALEFTALRGRAVERLTEATADALRARLRTGAVDEVVIAGMPPESARRLVETCDEAGLPALVRLDDDGFTHFPPQVEVVGTGIYMRYLRREPDPGLMLIKGLVDRLLAAIALVLTLPLALVIALAIKVGSRGPVLFVQRRGGLNGRPFSMLKFRTMREGAEAEREALLAANEMDGPVFKIRSDPRITAAGRWLRRTSLDELPQLVNVLVGHMSLVGPRPLPVEETRGLTGAHRRRLSVKPGLTCLWQVKGRNTVPFPEWMALDLEYIDNWSLGLDLVILLRTVPALLSGRGAG